MKANKILILIVVSQFFCTSVWFAGNAVIANIVNSLLPDPSYLAHVTSAVQFGFILGTLVFALFGISDRYSPSLVFFVCSVFCGIFNVLISYTEINLAGILLSRFLSGFFLAGIYPVGMKIASDYFQQGLGKSLGFLVGALVLGTAFPHLLKSFSGNLQWEYVIFTTSLLSLTGGSLIYFFVPDGPFRRQGRKVNFSNVLVIFDNKNFRSASFGYFGHMWELYTFWAFVPIILTHYFEFNKNYSPDIPFLSFLIIAYGSIACVLSGVFSQKWGPKKVATIALTISCLCCLLSPLVLFQSTFFIFLIFMFVWGMSVVADSPLFSTMVAKNAPEEFRGSSLTIVNCIGFSITIFSIQFLNLFTEVISMKYIYLLLAIGPVLGLYALVQKHNRIN